MLNFGAEKAFRACYEADRTGKGIMDTVWNESLKHDVNFIGQCIATEILLKDTTCVGAIIFRYPEGKFFAILAKATIILDYVEFEFRVAVTIVEAGGKIANKRAACVLCTGSLSKTETNWHGGTISIWSWNIFGFGFSDYTVVCKCVNGHVYATVPGEKGDVWVACW